MLKHKINLPQRNEQKQTKITVKSTPHEPVLHAMYTTNYRTVPVAPRDGIPVNSISAGSASIHRAATWCSRRDVIVCADGERVRLLCTRHQTLGHPIRMHSEIPPVFRRVEERTVVFVTSACIVTRAFTCRPATVVRKQFLCHRQQVA